MTDAPAKKPIPLLFRWNAEAGTMEPFNLSAARSQYVDQASYRLHPFEGRSRKSHNHLFALIADAFDNLPEQYADKFSDPEHLRKWSTIVAGYRTELVFPYETEADLDSIIRRVKRIDRYAIVDARDGTATAYFAESVAEMDKKRFQAAKDGILAVLAQRLGVSAETLAKHGGQHAIKTLWPERTTP